MADATTTIAMIQENIAKFAQARHWEPHHTPKNLVMALASEVGELCDLFRWLTPEQSVRVHDDADEHRAVADELADILNIVCLLGLHLRIDLSDAVTAKMIDNAKKYPEPDA